MATSQTADQPSNSRDKPSRQKIDKDKPWWDPILITYTELFPKLVEIDHIESVQLAPLRPPFPRWYNTHTRCNYHDGNLGIPRKIALHSNIRSEIWSMMENWSLRIWIDQLKSKTRLGQRWRCRNKSKRPQRKQISRKLQCQRRRKRKRCSKIWSSLG